MVGETILDVWDAVLSGGVVKAPAIRAAGGLQSWMRAMERGAAGKKRKKPEQEPLPPRWRPLLDIPGVDRKPVPGKMNTWEREFSRRLDLEMLAGIIVDWRYEVFRFTIAENRLFIPDFVTLLPDGSFAAQEVKGHEREDAMVKFDVAAYRYPRVRFAMWAKDGKGAWHAVR